MKLIYFKECWSCIAMSDLLAPTAKVQLSGGKLVLAMPFQSLSSTIRATSKGTPLTVNNMANAMLGMNLDSFIQGGGLCVRMSAGDFLWVPECSLIAEFAMKECDVDNDNDCGISKSLSWIAMTEYHCTQESVENMIKSQRTFLDHCCQPSQKSLESSLKVR